MSEEQPSPRQISMSTLSLDHPTVYLIRQRSKLRRSVWQRSKFSKDGSPRPEFFGVGFFLKEHRRFIGEEVDSLIQYILGTREIRFGWSGFEDVLHQGLGLL